MKKHLLHIGFATLLCVTGLRAHNLNRNPFYANVSLIKSFPSWSGVKGGYGIGAAFGADVWIHYAEIEVMYLMHRMDYSNSSLTLVPALITYRHEIPFERIFLNGSLWGIQFGGSAGFAVQKWKIPDRSNTKMVAAFAGQALLVYHFGDEGLMNAGIKALWTDKGSLRKSGVDILFFVGGSIRF